MAEAHQLFEDAIHLVLRDALEGMARGPVLLLHANDEVATAHVVDVVGKGTDGMDDGVGVETGLELHTV